MTHKHNQYEDEPAIDVDRVERRIQGRRSAAEVSEMLGDKIKDQHYLESFIETFQQWLTVSTAALEKAKVESIGRLGATEIPFGKHKGKTFDETPLSYLDWLCAKEESFDRDLRAYLKHPELESRRRGLDGGQS